MTTIKEIPGTAYIVLPDGTYARRLTVHTKGGREYYFLRHEGRMYRRPKELGAAPLGAKLPKPAKTTTR